LGEFFVAVKCLPKTAIANIEKALAGPSADYFSAAQYFYQSNGDINKRDPMLIKL
jgi:hypothetical protein